MSAAAKRPCVDADGLAPSVSTPEPAPALLEGKDKELFVSRMSDWNFGEGGIFQRAEECAGDLLYHLATQAVHYFGLCEKLGVNPEKFHNWVWAVQGSMKSQVQVPYHNATHVSDVLHGAWWFLAEADLAEHMTPEASFSLLIAAIAHDCGHPGLNNSWWTNTGSELARTYHERSVLENYHIRESLALMLRPDCNVLDGLEEKPKATIRDYFIDAVLSTDLALHDGVVEKFEAIVAAGGVFAKDKAADQKVLVMMALKASDIANPSKRWNVYKPWIDRLFREFYAQGDREKKLGLTPQPYMDRENSSSNPPKAQQGFIGYFMRPLFLRWAKFLPKIQVHLDAIEVSMSELQKWEKGL